MGTNPYPKEEASLKVGGHISIISLLLFSCFWHERELWSGSMTNTDPSSRNTVSSSLFPLLSSLSHWHSKVWTYWLKMTSSLWWSNCIVPSQIAAKDMGPNPEPPRFLPADDNYQKVLLEMPKYFTRGLKGFTGVEMPFNIVDILSNV